MSDTGWKSPGTVVGDSSTGGTAGWADYNNVKVSDGLYCNYYNTGDSVVDYKVRIVKSDGTIGTTDKADTATSWSDTDIYSSYGSVSDLWGETWSASDINDIDFGIAFSAHIKGSGYDTYTFYIKATNFGFNIPIGSTINGILVEVEKSRIVNTGVNVDHIRIKVYYTEATGTPTVGTKYPLPAFSV